jgi:2-polyprenyl-3-methyl-5-hydroxy-6-metoxy-1,4-benzoquinol methylase
MPALASPYWLLDEERPFRDEDGCPLEQWLAGTRAASFAVHPKGFPVFVRAAAVERSDEYRSGDPYSVEQGLETSAFQKRRQRRTLRLLAEALAASGSDGSARRDREPMILDVACGEGHLTAAMKRRFPAARVFGIDYSISAIDRASARFPELELSCGDAYALPYRPESFDVVVLNNIWEHVPDPLRLLDAVKRVLVADGRVIISTPSRFRLRNLIRVGVGRTVAFMSPHHVTEYTVGQVVEQLRFANMQVQVFDDPLDGRPSQGALGFVAFRLAMPSLRLLLRLLGSHHSLEETVFYLGKKSAGA